MAIATSLQLDDEPQPVEGAATSLVLDDDAHLQSQGNVATSLERDDSASRLDDLTFVPGDTDQAYEQWKEWLETQEKQSFGMDDAIEIGKTMFGELYDGGKAFAANLAEGEFQKIVNSLGEGALRGTADLGILSQKAKDRFTRDEALTRERFRGWREIRKLEAMREKARLGEEDLIDHLAGYGALEGLQTDDVDVDPALAEGASYGLDIGTVVGMPAAGLVRKGAGKKLAQLESKAFRGAGKLTAKGMQKTGDALRTTGRAIKDKVVEITPDWAAELVERHKGKIATAAFVAAPIPTGGVKLAVEAADRIGPAGSALEKMVDDLPEMPTNMGPLERTSKDMNQTEGIRKVASGLNWKGIGDGVIGFGKDVGRSAVYGAGTGAVLGGLAEGTEGAKSGAFAAGLTGGLGGVGGYALDTITGQRSAARMEGSINDLIKRHKGDQEAMAMLVDMANLEVVDKASGNLRNMARRALEDLATASEMLRGRVDIKVLPEEEFAKITKGRGVGGFYDPQTKEIILNADGAKLSDTLLHEVGEAMWDSGMVDTKSVRNQVAREYDLAKLKRSYAEQMLKAEKRGQPTDTEITQRVNELDRQYANDGAPDWVVREMFSENFMAVSTEEGMHNYLRNNSKLSKLLLAVQKAARGFSQTPMTGLGMVMTEAKATVFSVVDKAKGGLGLDGLGHKKNIKEPGDTKKPEEPKNIFNEDIDPNSELSKSYLKYAKALNRQYKAYEQGKEKTTKLLKDSSDDAVNWDGVGKEYFDDVPETPPSKGKDKRPQDSDSGAKGGGKKGTRKKAKNKKDLKKRARQRRKEVKQSLEPDMTESSVPEVTLKPKHDNSGNVKKGSKEYRGKFLQSKYSDASMMENFRGTIDEVNQAIANGRPIRSYYFGIGTRSLGDDTWMNSLTRNSGDIPATEVDYIPHEWFITNNGNVNVRVIDLNYVRGRVNSWRDSEKLDPWNNDVDAFLEDAKKYLDNHRNNISGAKGLTPKQHNIINALFQANNKTINPLYTAWDKNSGNRIYKNLRIERIASLRDTSANGTPFGMGPFDHLKAKQMFSPTRAPEAPARQLDDLGMFSKAQEAIEGMQQKKGTSQQFLKAMDKAGVKKEELEDIGLDVFLKDNPTTTKEDVLNFIKANQIEMVEVQEGGGDVPVVEITDIDGDYMSQSMGLPTFENNDAAYKFIDDHWVEFAGALIEKAGLKVYSGKDLNRKLFDEVPENEFVILSEPTSPGFAPSEVDYNQMSRGFPVFEETYSTFKEADKALYEAFKGEISENFSPELVPVGERGGGKFSEYTEPGAEPGTYTERLLTLPDPESKLQARYDELTEIFNRRNPTSEESAEYTELERRLAGEEFDTRFGPYTSSHFDEENIVAHVRHNDRIGPDGEKVLFLEEIQSDWHQEGRERRYTGRALTRAEKMEFDHLDHLDSLQSTKAYHEQMVEKATTSEERMNAQRELKGFMEVRYEPMTPQQRQRHDTLYNMRLDSQKGVPNAPFKKSWPEFSMKRMLKLAADEGYDAIAWTTGDTQNARYDLGNKINGMEVIEYEDGTYELMVRVPGEDVFKAVDHGMTKEKLQDHIGKEMTRRALDNMEGDLEEYGTRSALLEGEDLRLGGKGMRGFYDEMLPRLKLWKQTKDSKGKPLQVQQKTLRDGLQANYVALNEDVNSKVSAQGVPRYSPARPVSDTYNKLVSSKKVKKLTGKDLVGMKLFPIKADLTAAGDVYSGIDSSDILVPIELKGGPYFPLLKGIQKAGLAWANKGPGVSKIKSKMAQDGVYGVVLSMTPQAHKSNTDVSDAISQTVVAYIKSGRVEADKLESLNKEFSTWEMVMGKNKPKSLVFPDFPGLENPDKLLTYLNNLPFEKRAMFANKIDQAKFVEAGFPRVSRILDATMQPEFRGQPHGQALLVLKLDPRGDVVKLGENGIPSHRSYDFAVRGKLVGVLEKPISAEKLFPDHYKRRGKQSYYTLDRDWPVTSITEKVASKFGVDKFEHIKNPAQANAVLQGAIGDWYEVPRTGKGSADFSLAIGENYASPMLEPISKKQARDMVKTGELKVFQLGSDRSSNIYFALRSVNDGQGLEILNPINNQPGTSGSDLPGIMLKAIEEGATEIKTFAIPTGTNPRGARVDAIETFGFKETGRVKFNPEEQGTPNNQLADMMRVWESQGWNRGSEMPDIVQLTYQGTPDDRGKIRNRYLQQNSADLAKSSLVQLDAVGTEQRVAANRKAGRGTGARGSNRRQARRNQERTDDRMDRDNASIRSRFNAVLEELQSLSPDDADNLRIPEDLRQKARETFPGTRFSPVRQLNDRGGAIYRDGYGFRAVQTSSRAGVRIYSNKGRRVGPVFNSVEKAQDHLDKLRNN